jgi:hypothetical protein
MIGYLVQYIDSTGQTIILLVVDHDITVLRAWLSVVWGFPLFDNIFVFTICKKNL